MKYKKRSDYRNKFLAYHHFPCSITKREFIKHTFLNSETLKEATLDNKSVPLKPLASRTTVEIHALNRFFSNLDSRRC